MRVVLDDTANEGQGVADIPQHGKSPAKLQFKQMDPPSNFRGDVVTLTLYVTKIIHKLGAIE